MNEGYEPRTYRDGTGGALARCEVAIGDSDLAVYAAGDVRERALELLAAVRTGLEGYIRTHPDFLASMAPVPAAPDAPDVVRTMCGAAAAAGVGPMAAVAGAVAGAVGRDLVPGERLIIENGGDVFIRSGTDIRCAVHVPRSSPFHGRLVLRIPACPGGTGVCTSTGTFGHSFSAGRADAVAVLSDDVSLADAVATAVGNRICAAGDIIAGLAFALGVPGVHGALAVAGDRMAARGRIEFV